MRTHGRVASQGVLFVVLASLPCILLFSSIRTFRELGVQRSVYLRERVAQIAGKLETMAADANSGGIESLFETESNLRDLHIIRRETPAGSQPSLAAIWQGRELYKTESVETRDGPVYRAFVPFHGPDGLHIAQIDLDAHAADFLVVHARHNVWISLAGGVALVLLSLYGVWSARRSAALERRQMALEHLARLGRLSATLAHEIRNPLGAIKGFTQLAAERGDDSIRPLLDPVLRETGRLESLVNALLAYGRPPAPSKRRIRWPELAASLVPSAPAGASLQIDDRNLEFTTDPDLLKQILLNGVRNGFEAAQANSNPEVTVAIRAIAGNRVEIAIRDNGAGVPDEIRHKLMEPFFTTKASGAGLGLPISAQLAGVLGGSLEVRNRRGRGAEMVLVLDNADVVELAAPASHGTYSGS